MPDFGRWTGNGGDPSLNEINRDERFLDALATNQPVYATDQSEAELAFLLSDWRDEIRDTPITTVVTIRDAEIALHGAVGEVSRKRTRTSLALVGSVAAAVLCLGGFSAAVYGAGPGDSFYGIRTMLFGEAPARDDQVALASQQLAQVQQLIDQGDWQQAQDKLVTLSTTVQDVDQVERKQELIQQWNALTYKVVEQDPAATLPPPDQPQPVLPSSPLTLLPVPVIEATTTSTSPSDTSASDTSTSPSDTSSSSDTSGTTQPSDATSTSDTPTTTSTEPSTTTTSAPPTSTSTSASTSTSTTTSTSTIGTTSPTTTTTTTTRESPAAPPSSAVVPVGTASGGRTSGERGTACERRAARLTAARRGNADPGSTPGDPGSACGYPGAEHTQAGGGAESDGEAVGGTVSAAGGRRRSGDHHDRRAAGRQLNRIQCRFSVGFSVQRYPSGSDVASLSDASAYPRQ